MPPSKKAMLSADFNREISRYQIKLNFHPNHPVKSVDAGRLLCAFPDQCTSLRTRNPRNELRSSG